MSESMVINDVTYVADANAPDGTRMLVNMSLFSDAPAQYTCIVSSRDFARMRRHFGCQEHDDCRVSLPLARACWESRNGGGR